MDSTDSTVIPLSERKLSSLTDLEILELTSEIQTKAANESPLVGKVEPISVLVKEYEESGSIAFISKIKGLEKEGWTGLRRLRKDGNCFYGAFSYAFVERLLDEPPSKAVEALNSIEKLIPLLDQAGYVRDM